MQAYASAPLNARTPLHVRHEDDPDDDKDTTIKELAHLVLSLRTELAKVNQAKSDAAKTMNLMQKELDDVINENQELREKVASNDNRNPAVEESHQDAIAREKDLEQLKSVKRELQTKVDKLTIENKEKEKVILMLTVEKSEAREKIQRLDEDRSNADAAVAELRNDMQTTIRRVESEKEGTAHSVEKLRALERERNDTNASLKDMLNDLASASDESEAKIDDLICSNLKLKTALSMVMKENIGRESATNIEDFDCTFDAAGSTRNKNRFHRQGSMTSTSFASDTNTVEHHSSKMRVEAWDALKEKIALLIYNTSSELDVHSGRHDNANQPDRPVPPATHGGDTHEEGTLTCSSQVKIHRNGKYKGHYVGELDQNGQRNGHGTFTCDNGNVYVGTWKNDQREGTGRACYNTGDVYEGEWKGGKRHGHGKMRIANNDVFEGGWNLGLKHGVGTYRWSDGEIDVNWYRADKRIGEGVRWSVDRQRAYRLVRGTMTEEISLREAAAISESNGLPVPK